MKFIVLPLIFFFTSFLYAQSENVNPTYNFTETNVQQMVKVYIAGPYSKGDVAVNVRNAFAAADTLANLGFAPFVPHYTHFWHMMFPREYEFWLKLDKQFLPCCDALLRLPGESHGSDTEVAFAKNLGIPVFFDIDSLVNYFEELK